MFVNQPRALLFEMIEGGEQGSTFGDDSPADLEIRNPLLLDQVLGGSGLDVQELGDRATSVEQIHLVRHLCILVLSCHLSCPVVWPTIEKRRKPPLSSG